jgi:hypothetical protein
MQSLLTGTDNTTDAPPEHQIDVKNQDEETPDEGDSSTPTFWNFWIVIFKVTLKLSIITNILTLLIVKVSLNIKTNMHLRKIRIQYQKKQNRLKHKKIPLFFIYTMILLRILRD